jgi:hypothetical protein
MRGLVIILLSVFLLDSVSVASANDKASAVSEIEKSLETQALQLEGFKATTQRTTDSPKRKPNEPNTGSMVFLVTRKGYLIENRSPTGSTALKYSSITAFNGELYQRLNLGDRNLFIKSSKSPEFDPLMILSNDFLQPFQFLIPFVDNPDVPYVTLEMLNNQEVWKKYYAAIISQREETILGHPCLVIRTPGGKEEFSQQDSEFEVFFAKDLGYYPLAWKRFRKPKNELMWKYLVTKAEPIDGFFYPAEAMMFFYGGDQTYPIHEEPIGTTKIIMKDVELNPKAESDEFQIDPSLANTIWDGDTMKMIKVPK